MRLIGKTAKKAIAALLCLSLLVWSLTPVVSHVPTVFETIQDHLEMIAEHGHSHGFEEDLYWAVHGHSHDVAEHDHSQPFPAVPEGVPPSVPYRDLWLTGSDIRASARVFRIERPPRV